jgi:hypothetical protein
VISSQVEVRTSFGMSVVYFSERSQILQPCQPFCQFSNHLEKHRVFRNLLRLQPWYSRSWLLKCGCEGAPNVATTSRDGERLKEAVPSTSHDGERLQSVFGEVGVLTRDYGFESSSSSGEDSMLRSEDIIAIGLQWPTCLVVLSACNSSKGQVMHSLIVSLNMSFGGAFLKSGNLGELAVIVSAGLVMKIT